jgi:hypothetical protein
MVGGLYVRGNSHPLPSIPGGDPVAMHAAPPVIPDSPPDSSLPAEKVYKNVQVLRGMSAAEFMGTMSFMSASLGVRCGFCHVQGDFSLDDKPAKKTARGMIHMTRDINEKNFSEPAVTCYTCHRGSEMPVAVPSIAQGAWGDVDVREDHHFRGDSTTTANAVLDRYVQALGGEKALAKITTRVLRASEVQVGGTTATVDISQKAPNLLRSTTTSSDPKRGASVLVYEGHEGWMIFGNRPPMPAEGAELEQIVRDAELFPAADLRKTYSSIELLGREHIGDRDFYVVSATRGASSDRLYFDVATGLLARRYVEYHTPLGPVPFSVEYSDYREADGVKIPYTIKTNTLRESWTDTITQLRHNVAIPESVFAQPGGGK